MVNHPLKIANVFTLGLFNFDDFLSYFTSLIQFLKEGRPPNDLFWFLLTSFLIFWHPSHPLVCISVVFGVSNWDLKQDSNKNVQLSEYETDPNFLHFFQINNTVCLTIYLFCKNCEPEPEIVLIFVTKIISCSASGSQLLQNA